LWLTLSVRAAEGDIWVVGGDDTIYRRVCTDNAWEVMDGKLTKLSAGPNGELWGVSRKHQVYHWNGAGWTYIPGILAKTVAISKDGLKVAAIDLDGYMFAYDRQACEWVLLPGAEDYTFEDLAPSMRGIIALTDMDEIYELTLPQ
jgi:hypothetical protein